MVIIEAQRHSWLFSISLKEMYNFISIRNYFFFIQKNFPVSVLLCSLPLRHFLSATLHLKLNKLLPSLTLF